MGYYQAGDPGLFDFFEKGANAMFTAASRSTGHEFHADPGQLSLGRVYSQYIKPIAQYIPGVGQALMAGEAIYGGLQSLAGNFGSVGNFTAPTSADADEDVLSYARPSRARYSGYSTGMDDDDDDDAAMNYAAADYGFPDDGVSAGEMGHPSGVHTFSAPPPGRVEMMRRKY